MWDQLVVPDLPELLVRIIPTYVGSTAKVC